MVLLCRRMPALQLSLVVVMPPIVVGGSGRGGEQGEGGDKTTNWAHDFLPCISGNPVMGFLTSSFYQVIDILSMSTPFGIIAE